MRRNSKVILLAGMFSMRPSCFQYNGAGKKCCCFVDQLFPSF